LEDDVNNDGFKGFFDFSGEYTMETIKYSENIFDAVILLAVLTYITSDDEQIKLLNKIKDILKPNGIIYINDFLLNNYERNIKQYKEYELKYINYGIFELEEGAIMRHHNRIWVKKSLVILLYLSL
jgi:SAM-dependent methyltransferase